MPKSISFSKELRSRCNSEVFRTDFLLLSYSLYVFRQHLEDSLSDKEVKPSDVPAFKYSINRCKILSSLFDQLYHEI